MQKHDLLPSQNAAELEAKIALLEAKLDAVISEKDATIKKLTGDVEHLSFLNEQMRRLIFGSKRERFIPQTLPGQLTIDFEPQVGEIEASVKEEQEKIRVEYMRKKIKKEHPGRMQLPKHLAVNEIIMEPEEDTSDMVCIGCSLPYGKASRSGNYGRAGLHTCKTAHQPVYPQQVHYQRGRQSQSKAGDCLPE